MGIHVMQQGAAGDGKANDATVIQSAIDQCAAQGGGVVILDAGHTYCSGSLVLKDHVELHIESGAILKASDNLHDYHYISELAKQGHDHLVQIPTYEDCTYDGMPRQYFIYAKNSDHVCISGNGTIDGSEEIYYGERREDQIDGLFYPRIPLILMEHCTHLTIRNVTIRKSGFWTTHLVGCEEVCIDSVRILNNRMMANCDGIDPDHCKHVRITNCHIEAADDCIVLKTTEANRQYGTCEDIIISGCTLESTSAAIKIGTESVCDFKDIVITGCTIHDSNRGISFQLRDEGNIEHVIISNCIIQTRQASSCWWGCGEPINIASIDRKESVPSGEISDITISNIRCIGEGSVYIAGKKDSPLKSLVLSNVRNDLIKTSQYPITGYDFRPTCGSQFELGKISGMLLRNCENAVLEHVSVNIDDSMSDYVDQKIRLENTSTI